MMFQSTNITNFCLNWLLLAGMTCLALVWVDPQAAAAESNIICRYSLDHGWGSTGNRKTAYRKLDANNPDADDSSGVAQIVTKIREVLPFAPQVDIYLTTNTNEAFAAIVEGRRIIVLDKNFLIRLVQKTKTRWAAIQVIAHEIGHHIDRSVGRGHHREYNADYWSGQALQRLGAPKNASQQAILYVGSEIGSRTHPNRHRRALLIAKGWDDAARGRIDATHCNGCI